MNDRGFNMAEISVKTTEHPQGVTFEYNVPTTLEGLMAQIGEAQVVKFAVRGLTLAAQAYARQQLAAGKHPKDIKAAVAGWKPGTRKDASSKVRAMLDALPESQRAAVIQEVAERHSVSVG